MDARQAPEPREATIGRSAHCPLTHPGSRDADSADSDRAGALGAGYFLRRTYKRSLSTARFFFSSSIVSSVTG